MLREHGLELATYLLIVGYVMQEAARNWHLEIAFSFKMLFLHLMGEVIEPLLLQSTVVSTLFLSLF
jgi:hypothetical protein